MTLINRFPINPQPPEMRHRSPRPAEQRRAPSSPQPGLSSLPPHLSARSPTEACIRNHARQQDVASQCAHPPSLACRVSQAHYYEELVRHSLNAKMLYPYHLAAKLECSPFEYYTEMMAETMHSECSYDTIPNFTAADCMRLLRVGRNEFIHMMNTCRSKGWMWKRRGIANKLLPLACFQANY